jgi:hypothetical protein
MKTCIISFGLDLSKVTKAKIKTDEKGRKWLYLQASIQIEPDQYGNQASVWENQTKEERENNKRNYLGNGKITYFDTGSTTTVTQSEKEITGVESDNDDLPF